DLAFNIFARDRDAMSTLRKLAKQCEKTGRQLNFLSNTSKKGDRDFRDFAGGVFQAGKSLTIAAGALSVLAAGATQAAGAAVTLTAALAPSVGILGAVPALAGAAAGSFATLAVGVNGVGTAMG